MVIIYMVNGYKRRLSFDKDHARESDDSLAWRIRIVDRDRYGKKADTFTEHVIPKRDIVDIQNDQEMRSKRKQVDTNKPINPLTGF